VPAAAPAAPKRNRKIAIISVIVILSALTIVVAVTMGISLSRTATTARTHGVHIWAVLLTLRANFRSARCGAPARGRFKQAA